MAYYFDDDCVRDHWKCLENVETDEQAIKEGEKLKKSQYNSIVYKDVGRKLRAIKKWKAIK
jgi:hypothetical protein